MGLSRSRRFYWLWGVAVPFLVFLVVHVLVSHFSESQMIGLAAGVPVGITTWYVAESYYLRREEKQNRRSREQR